MHPPHLDDPHGALSIDRFCQQYNLGKTFVYEQIKERKLRAVKCGTRTLILHADAELWARSLPQMGGAL